jgi:F0F1-type ATP synthase assembly protein I
MNRTAHAIVGAAACLLLCDRFIGMSPLLAVIAVILGVAVTLLVTKNNSCSYN